MGIPQARLAGTAGLKQEIFWYPLVLLGCGSNGGCAGLDIEARKSPPSFLPHVEGELGFVAHLPSNHLPQDQGLGMEGAEHLYFSQGPDPTLGL